MIALGTKVYETRSWAPPRALIGQRIAIHAGKALTGFMPSVPGMRMRWVPTELNQYTGGYDRAEQFPLGCVVCTAVMAAAHHIRGEYSDWRARWGRAGGVTYVRTSLEDAMHAADDPTYKSLYERIPIDGTGDFSAGRWAWRLTDVQRLPEPVPATGRQGFWNWEPAL